MTEQNPNPVVVAVGQDPIDVALVFAAGEAVRAGCGLHLVHAVHVIPQGSEAILVTEVDLERAGRLAVNSALERAHDLVPAEVPVTADVGIGPIVPTLVEMTRDARMIVLERRDLGGMRRVVTRSVSSGVAARSRVPVVSVPSHWSPSRAHGDVAEVTVGIDVPERSEQVVRSGAAQARSRGVRMHLLHALSFPAAYEGIVLSSSDQEYWRSQATGQVQSLVDSLGSDVTGIPVLVDVRYAAAADALVEASRTSELLVIGRHDPLVPRGSHLGPIARAVLREAECPVLLASPVPARIWKRHSHRPAGTAGQPV